MERVRGRHRRRHPRPKLRRVDRERPAAARQGPRPPPDGADTARGASGPGQGLRRARARQGRVRGGDAASRRRALHDRLQELRDRARRRGERARRRGRRRGRRVPRAAPGAGLHRDERGGGVVGGRDARDARLAAVSPLRGEGAQGLLRAAGREGTRDPGRHGRRLRRQGGVPERHLCARGPFGAQGWAARQDHLRPPRGHGRDHQASPRRDPPSHRRHARRPHRRPGRRDRDGRRRLRDAVAGRSLARHAARHRSLRLPERPHPLARGDDEHAAERRLPRLRRAADALRRRDADRAAGRAARDRSARDPPPQRRPGGLDAADGADAARERRRAPRARGLREERAATRGGRASARAGTAARAGRAGAGSASRWSTTAPASRAAARCT